nr:septum formation initiator family protein [Corynebacterium lactis]
MSATDKPKTKGTLRTSRASSGLVHGARTLSKGEVVGIFLLLLFLVLTLSMPLRTFAQQRSDLAETRANIARMESRIAELEREKELYSDPAYAEEQARLRLGLIKPGETPFRILDPALGEEPVTNHPGEARQSDKAWYTALWDSISIPVETKPTVPNPGRDQATRPESLPTIPDDVHNGQGQQ